MKTTYRTTHISKPHSRAERALTLAVLTALLSRAAAPAMAKDRTIEEDETVDALYTNHKACLTYKDRATGQETATNNITNSPSGNTLTILGKVIQSDKDATSYVTAAYSGGGQMSCLTTTYSFKAARSRSLRGMSAAATPRAAM